MEGLVLSLLAGFLQHELSHLDSSDRRKITGKFYCFLGAGEIISRPVSASSPGFSADGFRRSHQAHKY